MQTVTSLIQSITKELGYNPYQGIETRRGYIPFVEVTAADADEFYMATIYHTLKAVVNQPIERFFDFVNFVVCDDPYITALMIEIYRRVGTKPVTVYFSKNQYIEADSPSDLSMAIDKIRNLPSFGDLTLYQGINSGLHIHYVNMTDEYLLNAWFQRVYNELSKSRVDSLPMIDVNKVIEVSPQIDGVTLFVQLMQR